MDASVEQTPASHRNLSHTTHAELEIESTVDGLSRPGVCTEENFGFPDALSYFMILMGIALLCENLLLIYVICRTRSLHSITNILVASMGLTDVLVGVQCCMMGLIRLPNGLRSWLDLTPSDMHVFDSIMVSLSTGLVSVSILHVSLLAVDRYLYILWPFHYTQRVTRSRVLLTAGGIWMLGLGYVLLLTVQFQSEEYQTICIISQTPVAYKYWPFVVIYFLCLIVVIACTFGTTKIALDHRRRRKMRMLGQATNKDSVNEINGNNIKGADTTTKNAQNQNDDLCVAYQNKDPVKASIPSMELELCHNKFVTDFVSFVRSNYGAIFDIVQASDCSGHSDFVETETSANARGETNAQTISPEVSKANNMPHSEGSEAAITIIPDQLKTIQNDNGLGKAFNGTGKLVRDTHNCLDLSQNEPGNSKNKKDDGLFRKASLKIIKFIVVIFGSFFVCTFPSLLLITIVKIMDKPIIADYIFDQLQFPIVLNSGMNFLIITYMNKDFRTALAQRLSCCRVFCLRNSGR
ncbi:5-hydroxytryptamine receptor 2b [Plakobranchus ocellatus]|uniref:5-hydroxytryptamine receptor 2b n=1 Tax=Plakobranchus ocellatus TaxID=259542 RepID=A0AAV4BRV2_9GAST|nr:5-hydroxytryptamine receptor 2b [Plakobranchus ocellatus]